MTPKRLAQLLQNNVEGIRSASTVIKYTLKIEYISLDGDTGNISVIVTDEGGSNE